MKIWILSSETPHFEAGGIARYVDNFARLAAARGEEITVISRGALERQTLVSKGYRQIEFKDRGEQARQPVKVDQPDLHPGWPYNNMTHWAALSFQYAEVVDQLILGEGPPDVIECQDYAAVGYFVMMRKLCGDPKLAGIPMLLHLHTPDCIVQRFNQYPRYKLPDYWIGRMELACVWMADSVIAPSRFMASRINEYTDGERSDISVIPYPVPSLPDQSVENGETLLYAGRIELRKGVEQLLIACDRLWNAGRDFRLELTGGDVHTPLRGGSPTAYLKNKYSAHIESGRLHFHGPQSHQDTLDLMRSARAVVVPSLWENFPNTCIEAMALGKAVVASSSGGQAEMIGADGRAGILFDHDKPGELEEALAKVLDMSPEARLYMGEAARNRIMEICSPGAVLDRRMEHFSSVINGHSQRDRFPFPNRLLRESPPAGQLPDDPLVTVAVPFYNLGRYLGECVDSILASKGVRLEVLIVNDGSTDPDSLKVLDELRRREGESFRILDIANRGLANARNVAAREARGELVAFVDADDRIGPDFLARAAGVMKRYRNVHLVYSWVRYFDGGRGIWHSWTFDLPYLLCHNQLIPIVVVRRDSFLKHGQNKPHIVYGLEDFEGWISLAEAGCGGVAIPEALVEYRIREDSMFRVIDFDKKLYLYDLISHEHPELYREYGLELFNLQNANGPALGWDQPTMFRAPQDRLMGRLQRAEDKLTALEADYRRLSEAELWHQKELARLTDVSGDNQISKQ
jgi:glycosyltransferase involved in cell wall biosynthesis